MASTGIVKFSTDHFRPSQRLKVWRSHLSEFYFDLQATADEDFAFGRIAGRSFGNVSVSALTSGGCRVERTKASAESDRVEKFCIVLPTHGEFVHRQRGRERSTGIGGAFILNSSEPYEVNHSGSVAMACLTIPCDAVRARISNIDDLCTTQVALDQLMTATLRRFVLHALKAGLFVDEDPLATMCATMIEMMVFRPSDAPGIAQVAAQ